MKGRDAQIRDPTMIKIRGIEISVFHNTYVACTYKVLI